MAEPAGGESLGVYVHWPFCQAKCPYCDFNSHVAASIDQDAWARAFLRELDTLTEAYGLRGRRLTSVFFGGGTPSLMEPFVVGRVLDAVGAQFDMAPDAEITLEANPTSVEAARFRGYRSAGVNRVSLGVQSLDDGHLRALGRLHDSAAALRAIATAEATFPRVSFDLIYARQNQSLQDWRRELGRALDLAADHLSLYQLTIEPGTAFGARHARGLLAGLPSDDLAADMYELTQDLCEAAGYPAYEVSNHAMPGGESAHNLLYWRGEAWLGLGPGAHGRVSVNGTRLATVGLRMPDDWRAAVETKGHGLESEEAVAPASQAIEYAMMALRLTEGMDIARYEALAGAPLDMAGVHDLVGMGLLDLKGDRLATTRQGRPVLNAVLRRVLGED